MKKAKSIMLQGTASNVGKSVLVAGLCRIFKKDGFSVAPFKAQNMALNSYVTKNGKEMGRAQVTQAYACNLEPDVRMNPVLLKPNSDTGSQIILNGKPIGNLNAKDYYKRKRTLFPEVIKAYNSLADEHDIIVLEGAGSCAEINLRKNDIVNMAMAREIEAPVLVIGDIDRGGVFAHFVGTYEVLEKKDRELIKGFIVNKFRGDAALLTPAFDFVFQKTGIPTLGVVHWLKDLNLPDEDSVEFKEKIDELNYDPNKDINIAVIDLPHISNFTDFDPFKFDDDVNVVFTNKTDDLEKFDIIILPGSKNTISDLLYLKQKGFHEKLLNVSKTTMIVGVCGGYQMLGNEIIDKDKIESDNIKIEGFKLLNHKTNILTEKTLIQTKAKSKKYNCKVSGYEIHHGKTISEDNVIFENNEGEIIGTENKKGNIWGTYLHGIFDNNDFRNQLLNEIRTKKNINKKTCFNFSYDKELSKLAEMLREMLNMKEIYKIIGVK